MQALQGVSFEWWKVYLKAQRSPHWWQGVTDYEHTFNADIARSANTCPVCPAKDNGGPQLEADRLSLLHRPSNQHALTRLSDGIELARLVPLAFEDKWPRLVLR